jgi:phosphatidylserine decarboxylase
MIHREGRRLLLLLAGVFLVLNVLLALFFAQALPISIAVSALIFIFFLQFFRNPRRPLPKEGDAYVYAPADGKVVVVEETFEPEYFKDNRLQVSIFMSPLNVHVNRSPVRGVVTYVQHHPGKYLVAWHPKSSTENERTTTVIEGPEGEILLRQIAGAAAKRIVNYLKPRQAIGQGEEIGFIKFGSRVDLLLPLAYRPYLQVAVGDKVRNNIDLIVKIP